MSKLTTALHENNQVILRIMQYVELLQQQSQTCPF